MRSWVFVASLGVSAACGGTRLDDRGVEPTSELGSDEPVLGGDGVLAGDDGGDSAGDGDSVVPGDGDGTSGDGDAPPAASSYEQCFQAIIDPADIQPDYSGSDMVVGSHCRGTNHQNIRGIERVVFLGDSVTVGTPPTASSDWYRNRLADALASEFGLSAPNALWRTVNYVSGETLVRESGDFASCARYGARADDLMRDDSQVIDCIPEGERDKRTLIVMTMGGNDLNSIMQGFGEGKSEADLWTETESFIQDLRDTLAWLKAPGRFPNGVNVVLSNLYEYTDGTGKVTSCPGAALAGYKDIEDPALTEMVIWTMEQYVAMAADYDVDLMFLLEQFCGHGYVRNDPTSRCYRGPGSELWFDDTCIHPNSRGHLEIKDMVMSIVRE